MSIRFSKRLEISSSIISFLGGCQFLFLSLFYHPFSATDPLSKKKMRVLPDKKPKIVVFTIVTTNETSTDSRNMKLIVGIFRKSHKNICRSLKTVTGVNFYQRKDNNEYIEIDSSVIVYTDIYHVFVCKKKPSYNDWGKWALEHIKTQEKPKKKIDFPDVIPKKSSSSTAIVIPDVEKEPQHVF